MAESVELATILLTDLVGSTRLATSVGPVRADELREEHFRLLRDAIASCGGREVKNTGDGLMVAFASASAAVRCATLMQQLSERRYRNAEQVLEIRIGLGAGESTVKDGDYFGMPSTEAARLCAQAPAEGILVSAAVRMLAGRTDGIEFEPAGEFELKGFPESVQAFAVPWAPLAEEAGEAAEVGAWPLPKLLHSLPTVSYVGRVGQRAALEGAQTQARAGERQVALLSGEPGIGKSRLCGYVAHGAHAQGFAVLWGSCSDELGVPYEPWIEACSQLVEHAARELLSTHVERHGGELSRLAPDLRRRVSEASEPRSSDPETERYLLFSAVAGLLGAVADTVPVCLVLDDMHWADAQSIALLKHIVRAVEQEPLLMIATYRDSELDKDHPLTAALADLRRIEGVQRIALHGLGAEEVAEILTAVAGHELDRDGIELAAQIAEETGGNPFFVSETLRSLRESGAIVLDESTGRWSVDWSERLRLPESVREVVERRVERLGHDARGALTVGAVIGRSFDLEELSAIMDVDESALLDLLEAAVAASLVEESDEQPGRFRFAHALVNQTLYQGLGATRRALMHHRVAEALERLYGAHLGEHLSELALHWRLAAVSVDKAKAADYALRAGQQALAGLAPDEAMRLFADAVELMGDVQSAERCEALIGLGEAQRQVGTPDDFRQTLLDAAALAQELGDSDRLCRAVLANNRGWNSQLNAVDSERVRALEATAEALPDGDHRRARVLALLALELHYGAESARCRALVAEAIEIARAADDPAVLAHTLQDAILAIWTPDTLRQRERLQRELIELADDLDDPRLKAIAGDRGMMMGAEAGDRTQVELNLAARREVAASVPDPSLSWTLAWFESGWAHAQGELETAERLAVEAHQLATASGQPDAPLIFGALLAQVRFAQGRLGELVEPSLRLADAKYRRSPWRAAAALALTESAREDEARERALAEDLQSVPLDQVWLGAMLIWAEVCSRLRLPDRAGELYELAAPFSGQVVQAGFIVYGSSDWALGTLASTLERYEQAEDHFAAAAEIEERLGAPLFLARTHTGWARTLIARGQPEDINRARQILEQAEEVASRLGGGLVIREVAECRTALAAIGS
ncbi:MAG TPA: AAA family ATPase [Solirubrobacteraceae bacterium]|nr:AAA family ATPase [Solirubrobacteraceae bacterium]